jgi:phenylpropionate dioxygenase-like ring-hydroxylating dioxygenase large terminal subunit
VDILGTRVTLFRDEEGKVVCVDDTCPHRWVGKGAALQQAQLPVVA